MVTSYTQTNLVKYDEKRYLSQFVSDMFGSLQYDLLNKRHNLISLILSIKIIVDRLMLKSLGQMKDNCINVFLVLNSQYSGMKCKVWSHTLRRHDLTAETIRKLSGYPTGCSLLRRLTFFGLVRQSSSKNVCVGGQIGCRE